MKVDCEGCAGCCIDWRPLTDETVDHERRGRYLPLDDAYNLVPLARDEIRAFVDAGYGDALQPRLFRSEGGGGGGDGGGSGGENDASATIDGESVAAIRGRPAFYVGLRKPPKPVAPFDGDPRWLDTCAFLDPTTLQCRIHGDDLYPETCGTYPGENLTLGVETECERVERAAPGADRDRLLDDEPPDDARPLFGPAALGTRVFAHPHPDRLSGVVDRLTAGESTAADRAEFVAVAAAASPGTLRISDDVYDRTRETVLSAESWVGRAFEAWTRRAGERGSEAPDPAVAREVEDGDGAPPTPGWAALADDAGSDRSR